jgi:hypothetical protein
MSGEYAFNDENEKSMAMTDIYKKWIEFKDGGENQNLTFTLNRNGDEKQTVSKNLNDFVSKLPGIPDDDYRHE